MKPPLAFSILSAVVIISCSPASAQNQTTFRDAGGRTEFGTAQTDSQGTTTFRDAGGRTTCTASRDSGGTITFRDAGGRTTGTASTPRR